MDDEELKLAKLLGAKLRLLRQARGWTQATLAERAELTPHYVALLETARKLPTLKTLNELARALGASPAELLAAGDARPDSWLAEVSQIASAIPEPNRLLVRDMLRAAARHYRKPGNQAKRSAYPTRRDPRASRKRRA